MYVESLLKSTNTNQYTDIIMHYTQELIAAYIVFGNIFLSQ